MEFKSFTAQIKEISDRNVTGFAAIMGNIDDGHDRLFPGAFAKTLQERRDRVRHLWMHDASMPPTAAIVDMHEVSSADLPAELLAKYPTASGALQVTRKYLETPRAEEIFQGIVNGAINEMSFGYDAVKFDFEEAFDPMMGMIRNLRELRLWDTSDVNWGMNSATVASKAAVPYHDYGTADAETAWEGVKADAFGDFESLTDSEKRRVANHFAWSENMPPESFSDLKLPHHSAAAEGVGPAVWKGVQASMNALMRDADIPESARRGVYNHLAKHYEQFGKEAPDFKFVEIAYHASKLGDGDDLRKKVGRVLSSANFDRLQQALAALQEILSAAEPQEDPKRVAALTASTLKRLAIAQRDPILVAME